MELGKAIRIMREARSLSAKKLADEAKVSIAMLSQIENGGRAPSLDLLNRLCGVLHIPLDVFLASTQPGEGTLRSDDARTDHLSQTLQKMHDAEAELRELLDA